MKCNVNIQCVVDVVELQYFVSVETAQPPTFPQSRHISQLALCSLVMPLWQCSTLCLIEWLAIAYRYNKTTKSKYHISRYTLQHVRTLQSMRWRPSENVFMNQILTLDSWAFRIKLIKSGSSDIKTKRADLISLWASDVSLFCRALSLFFSLLLLLKDCQMKNFQ